MNHISRIFFLFFVFSSILGLSQISAGPNTSGEAQKDNQLSKQFSDTELVQILKNDGYTVVKLLKPRVIGLRVNGQTFLLFNHKDGDLQIYYAVGGVKLSYKTINEWNRTKRLSRAYLDEKKEIVLEADLLANAGISKKHVTAFVLVFIDSARLFRQFLIDNQEHEQKSNQPASNKADTIS